MTYNPHTNGRRMAHDYGEVPDARERECDECHGDGWCITKSEDSDLFFEMPVCLSCGGTGKKQCGCGYMTRGNITDWETCDLHTPPEPEGA